MGVKVYDGVKFVSPNGLTTKTMAIDNSGNPLFDSAQLAKQSDVGVANSALVKTAINADGSAPIYACRAWVNFNGTGTIAIRGSGNVSSITDRGTGQYTVNFTTAMPDTNYSVQYTSDGLIDGIDNATPATSSVGIYSYERFSTFTLKDSAVCYVAIFR